MRKKKYVQSCSLEEAFYGKKRTTSKGSTSDSKRPGKEIVDAFNKYYRSPVSNLYKAVMKSR